MTESAVEDVDASTPASDHVHRVYDATLNIRYAGILAEPSTKSGEVPGKRNAVVVMALMVIAVVGMVTLTEALTEAFMVALTEASMVAVEDAVVATADGTRIPILVQS